MAIRISPEFREEILRSVQSEFSAQQKTWGEWKDKEMATQIVIEHDYRHGRYVLRNQNNPEEAYYVDDFQINNGNWKNFDWPLDVKAKFALFLRQKGGIVPTPKEIEQRRHIPEVIERTGDKWYSWGLLRLKTVNGRWVAQAAVQLQDNANVEQHSTMVGYGVTKLEALRDLQEQMYETRALIEDAIVNVKARTIEEEKLQGEE